jgi:hypothetical protein
LRTGSFYQVHYERSEFKHNERIGGETSIMQNGIETVAFQSHFLTL